MWKDHRHYQTVIKASIDIGKPPRCLIFDDFSLEWNEWDSKLIKAYYFLQNMMQGQWPVWIADSDRVKWEVKKKHSRPQVALDKAKHTEEKRMQKKNATPDFGLYFELEPKVMDGGNMPTMIEWLDERAEKDGLKK